MKVSISLLENIVIDIVFDTMMGIKSTKSLPKIHSKKIRGSIFTRHQTMEVLRVTRVSIVQHVR
jgi:hypothetical protein